MSWALDEIKRKMELGKELGRQKRLEHNTKVKKFFGRKKKDENNKKS